MSRLTATVRRLGSAVVGAVLAAALLDEPLPQDGLTVASPDWPATPRTLTPAQVREATGPDFGRRSDLWDTDPDLSGRRSA